MKGLELSRKYYDTYIDSLLTKVPEARGRIAAGLVGEGSQCFGYDDAISKDHDFGPGFCIWLADEDFEVFGQKLQQAYDQLPDDFAGFSRDGFIAKDRCGVIKVSDFYRRFTGSPDGEPKGLLDWLFIPESQLATATNGEVFLDEPGLFTEVRHRLLEFYPEDVRRKKIAARAAVMAQAGQYNLLRSIQRQDSVTTLQTMGRFVEATISMAHLLEKRYTPFYKWGFRSLQTLSLGEILGPQLEKLLTISSSQEAFHVTESICSTIAKELRSQGLSTSSSNFLQDHLPEIMAGIKDPQLRSLPPMIDCQN